MRRFARILSRFLLVTLVALGVVAGFWLGLVPQRLSPFSPLSLSEPAQWFLDPRLAALRRDPMLCRAVLQAPFIEASPIPDRPYKDGCGWLNGVRIETVAQAKLVVPTISCEMAAALALWMEHEVQPQAQAMLASRVSAIEHMGTYSCRNVVGSATWGAFRSQHATANALDIAGFVLEDGRQISVLRDWTTQAREGQFLREVHLRACRYFRVAIGPEHNAAHQNHFHYDRGLLRSCR